MNKISPLTQQIILERLYHNIDLIYLHDGCKARNLQMALPMLIVYISQCRQSYEVEYA